MSKLQKGSFFSNLPQPDPNEGKHRLTSGLSEEKQKPAQQANPTSKKKTAEPAPVLKKETSESASGPEVTRPVGRPRNPDIVREPGSNKGLRRGDTRVTVVASEDLIAWYRDYSYTTGLTRREAIEAALKAYKEQIEASGMEIRTHPRYQH